MKGHFKGFPKIVIYHSCRFRDGEICSQTSRSTIGKLQRKVIFLEPVSAALLLLETAVIALFWVMSLLKAFLTPLLATVLQLKEQCRYRMVVKIIQ